MPCQTECDLWPPAPGPDVFEFQVSLPGRWMTVALLGSAVPEDRRGNKRQFLRPCDQSLKCETAGQKEKDDDVRAHTASERAQARHWDPAGGQC
jgi:hypothetical protein